MRIATWNVNSLRVRLQQLLDWLPVMAPDVVALQETKLTDDKFPVAELRAAGYQALWSGQPTYNGVALLARGGLHTAQVGLPGFSDPQRRVLAASFGTLRVVCVYVPNGSSVASDKYRYKLDWLAALTAYVRAELAAYPELVLLGDFNIAPEDRDVHDPAAWTGEVLVSAPEREALRQLLDLGLTDSYRHQHPEGADFSWWDYRQAAFRRNAGLRIDHVLCSTALRGRLGDCQVDVAPRRLERPSDHAPVLLDLDLALPDSAGAHWDMSVVQAQLADLAREGVAAPTE